MWPIACRHKRNNKGQAIMSEYVMIFFVVVAAAIAMTTYLQRAFEARIHEAKDFSINSVMSSSVCDANCMKATGGSISYGYEPYYSVMGSNLITGKEDFSGTTNGSANIIGVKYINFTNEATNTISASDQLPPCCNMNPVPGWCGACGANETL
jgi:hypothetical protein